MLNYITYIKAHMAKLTNRQGNFIIFGILFILIAFAIVNQLWKKNDLKSDGIIVNAVIIDMLVPTKGVPSYQYKFVYNGKVYTDDNNRGIQTKYFFIGKTFPAMFSPKTGNSELLMTPEDFKEYGLNFPDSLRWVLQFRN